MKSVRVGVVGLGYWGPNLARNFSSLTEAELRWCCDMDPSRLERWRQTFPGTRFTNDLGDLLSDDELDAIVVATPVPTHAEVAHMVLEAGKHCFVEKPLAQRVVDAEGVRDLAERKGLTLMVGHLLEFHPGIRRLVDMANEGELGEIFYMYSHRLNLGMLRSDENALWSLGAHDVSVVLALVGEEPARAVAHGESYVRKGVEDVVFCDLKFPSGITAHLHLSWLDPHKARRITVVGSKRMATFDDMAVEQKLKVFDKGFDPDYSSYGEYITRSGDVWSPQISNEEPLRIECRHFVEAIAGNREPLTTGESGVRVVRVLDALQRSLESS